jgi:hypothetical protein
MTAIVRSSGQQQLSAPQHSVLGDRPARIPVGGKIRVGIKVLTSGARSLAGAQDLYDEMVAGGRTWDEIEKAILDAHPGYKKSPLAPKNVPYFTVRGADFAVPELADRILTLYAEDRGEGDRLYRFPLILLSDDWMANLPHGFACHVKSERLYWSEYDTSGNRYCMQWAPVHVDARARRAARPFGGREKMVRSDNGGECKPNSCEEYQSRRCNLSGQLLCLIPGVPGSAAISVSTTSFYALAQMRTTMEMVALIRGGRISGLLDGKPLFYLTKRQDEVSMLDPETGKARRVKQWIVHLESTIDVSQMLDSDGDEAAGARAAHALTVAQPDRPADPDPVEPEPAYEEAETAEDEPGAPPEPQPQNDEEVRELRKTTLALCNEYAIDPGVFKRYAAEKWGAGWATDSSCLHRAVAELKDARDRLDDYLTRSGLDVPF